MGIYTSTPETFVDGLPLYAAQLNAIRDFMSAVAGAWNSYTPTISQGSATDIGKTVTYAKYTRVGKRVEVQLKLAVTVNSGAGGSAIRISLPVTAATSGLIVGSGTFLNQDGTLTPLVVRTATTTTIELVRTEATGTSTSALGAAPSLECGIGDYIAACLVYEAA